MAKKMNFQSTAITLGALAIVALVVGIFGGFIKLPTGTAATQPVAQPAGSVVQYTTASLTFTMMDKLAQTAATPVAGTYFYRLPGQQYTSGTTFTAATQQTLTGLPVGQVGFQMAFRNNTSTGLIFLSEYTFDLLDNTGKLTPLVTIQLPALKVGTIFAEQRKSGSTNNSIRLASGETNVDYTLFFRQNTNDASWRKPAACVFYNATAFTSIKLMNPANSQELSTFPIPTKYSGVSIQGGAGQKCYDLTPLVPALSPSETATFGDTKGVTVGNFLRNIQSAQANIQYQAASIYGAADTSNVTFRFLGSAKYFDKDGNTILDGYEDVNNGFVNVTANILDYTLVIGLDGHVGNGTG